LDHERQALADEPGVWAPLATQREVLGDPQSRPNSYLVANVDEQGIEHEMVADPVQFDETPPPPRHAPEHSHTSRKSAQPRLKRPGQNRQTDNGAEFQSSFHGHVLDQGIGHIYIRPGTPRLNGKVGLHTASTPRSSTDYSTVLLRTTPACSTKDSRNWEDCYNYHRPHGGLGGQTPYERLLQKTKAQPVTGHRQPDA
jgi:Integrase core domain